MQEDGVTTRVRRGISYDGTEFTGWARQPGLRTVQGVLEESLSKVLREPLQLTVAGRTDAGVHAEGQVAHFDTESEFDAGKLMYRMAKFLPKDVRIRSEEHTSELQSLMRISYAVFCLKKKKNTTTR